MLGIESGLVMDFEDFCEFGVTDLTVIFESCTALILTMSYAYTIDLSTYPQTTIIRFAKDHIYQILLWL